MNEGWLVWNAGNLKGKVEQLESIYDNGLLFMTSALNGEEASILKRTRIRRGKATIHGRLSEGREEGEKFTNFLRASLMTAL